MRTEATHIGCLCSNSNKINRWRYPNQRKIYFLLNCCYSLQAFRFALFLIAPNTAILFVPLCVCVHVTLVVPAIFRPFAIFRKCTCSSPQYFFVLSFNSFAFTVTKWKWSAKCQHDRNEILCTLHTYSSSTTTAKNYSHFIYENENTFCHVRVHLYLLPHTRLVHLFEPATTVAPHRRTMYVCIAHCHPTDHTTSSETTSQHLQNNI